MSLKDAALAVVKDAPPVSVGGAMLFGISLNTWVLVATLVYTLLRIYFMIVDRQKGKKDVEQD